MSDKPDYEAALAMAERMAKHACAHVSDDLSQFTNLGRAYVELERDHQAMEALRHGDISLDYFYGEPRVWVAEVDDGGSGDRPQYKADDPADAILGAAEKTKNGK